MSATEFKVGDYVILKNHPVAKGVVSAIRPGVYSVEVFWRSFGYRGTERPEDLELDFSIKFKVGDRVRWTCAPEGDNRLNGTVKRIDDGRIAVLFDGNLVESYFYEERLSDLALIDGPSTPEVTRCDCGGAAAQTTHSHWCSAPTDNVKRKKGLDAT
jgi:hypothetical protein